MNTPVPNYLHPSFYLVSQTVPEPGMALAHNVNTPVELIAYCARVSNPENRSNSASAARLIRYLIKHQHWSPLEMVDVTIGITTARDIGRQILRHRSFVFQEFSQRYAEVDTDRHCLREARLQDPVNRQSSTLCFDGMLINNWVTQQMFVLEAARKAYDWAIKNGIAKECARVVLPEGLTLTDMHMKGSLRSWIHYLDLRTGNGTQLEHQSLALAIAKAINKLFPVEQLHDVP